MRSYTAEIKAVWDDASIGPRHQKAELKFSLAALLPDVMSLSAIEPVRLAGGGGRGGGRGGGPLSPLMRDVKRSEGVIAARAGSEVEYDVKGLYTTFTAQAAIDDAFKGTIQLAVVGDGKELWTSGPLAPGGDRVKPVQVSIAGVKRLVLRATSVGAPPAVGAGTAGQASGRGGGGQAGWIDARISGLAAETRPGSR